MKTSLSSQGRAHPDAIGRGWVSGKRAGSTGITVTDGTTSVGGTFELSVEGGTIVFTEDGKALLIIDEPAGFLTDHLGEQHQLTTSGDAGAALDLDLSTANWFDITLTGDCTFTFSNPPGPGLGGEWAIGLRGEFAVTWPTEVVWRDTDGTATTTAPTMSGAFNHIVLTTLDGGVSYGAALDNGGTGSSAGLTVQDEGTPLATDATTLNFAGSGVVASGTGATKTITITSSSGQHILLADGHATPFTFNDLLQMDDGSDFMWSDA